MYVQQIEFHVKDEMEPEVIWDISNTYLGALNMSGQICGKDWPLYFENERCVSIVLTPEINSLDVSFNSVYVKNHFADAEKIGVFISWHLLGTDAGGECCNCSDSSAYALFTTYLSMQSPVSCLDCSRQVPLYKFPVMSSGEYYELICWQSNYQACDSLQMKCEILEKSATRQLSDLRSSLTKQGRSYCETLSVLANKPFYYYLYRGNGRSATLEKKRRCPSCGDSWYLENPSNSIFHFKCDHCMLLSNVAWNVARSV